MQLNYKLHGCQHSFFRAVVIVMLKTDLYFLYCIYFSYCFFNFILE